MNKLRVPTEKEITDAINADWSRPLVTFLCITYNQEKYIEDTLIGFLRQKTSFPYEILVHDDCSTDDTKKVIDSYKARYPNLIRTVYQKENRHSKGEFITLIAAKYARAKYIALCEGDDYWINEDKIESQLSLMLLDSSVTMVVSSGKARHDAKILNEIIGYHGNSIKQISAQYILDCAGSLAPTASYIVEKDHLIKALEFFKGAPVGDLFIELYNAINGRLIYYPQVSCVYRTMAKNSWSEAMASNKVKSMEVFIDSMEDAIEHSKKLANLDWSTKLSAFYYYLSRIHLELNNYVEFRKNIEISFKYRKINKYQAILYKIRFSKILLAGVNNVIRINRKYIKL